MEGGGFVVNLVVAKVIRQRMFFFTVSYFLYNNFKKKDMIVLVHKNPDKMIKCYTRPIFFNGFDQADLVILYVVPNIYHKIK